jgi:hypothetical protein
LKKEETSVEATLEGWIEPGIARISGERRSRQRFALQLPLEYRVIGTKASAGYATTRDLSSAGIAFELDEELPARCQMELALQWPIPMEGGTPLKLVLRGTLLRKEQGLAVLKVQRCQFRSQPRAMAAGMDFVL